MGPSMVADSNNPLSLELEHDPPSQLSATPFFAASDVSSAVADEVRADRARVRQIDFADAVERVMVFYVVDI